MSIINNIEQKITPVMSKMSSNKVINAIMRGAIATMPLQLGTCLIAILVNFPIESWTNWLAATGINVHMNAIIDGGTQFIALFMVFTIAYNYAKLKGHDALTAGILSLASFIALMPQQVKLGKDVITALTQNYLGSTGIFTGMIIAIVITMIYCYLDKKGLVIKLPDTVPEMVTKSLSPTFISMIIFVIVLLIRVAFGATSYGNIFDFITKTIAAPIMLFGSSPWSFIAICTIINFFWFFGIHPDTIYSVYYPVIFAATTANITAFQSGKPVPYLAFLSIYSYLAIGGTGSTFGLVISMLLGAKSERFKAMGKLAVVPSIFNINEPLIFGTPIIYNPIFFIPLVLSAPIGGGIGMLFIKLGAHASFNPTIQLPWTMPAPIGTLISTGIFAALGVCVATVATTLLYFPFFKYADRQALKEEQEGTISE